MGIGIDDYHAATSAIFSAAIEPARWVMVLDTLESHVPGICTHIFAHDKRTGEMFAGETRGYDPSYLDTYDAHFHALNAWLPGFIARPEGTVIHSYDMCPDDALERTEFYQDWVRPQEDIKGGGGMVIAQNEDSVCVLGGNIPAKWRDTKENPWMELVRQISPALSLAWKISRQLAGGVLERALLASTAERDPAFLITDAAGRILYQNSRATLLLAEGDVVRYDLKNRLRFRDTRAQARLEAVGDGPGPRAVGGTFTLVTPKGSRAVHLARFDRQIEDGWDLGLFLGIRSPSVLTVIAPHETSADPATLLGRSLGLSAAEAEVALALIEGQAPRDIAEARQVSLHTVRNQIRMAMEKLGVHRQAQLALRVSETLGAASANAPAAF